MASAVEGFLDDIWGRPVSDELQERRQGYTALGERMAAVETRLGTNTAELGMLRPVVHRLVSETSALVLQGEQQMRDHTRMFEMVDRLSDLLDRISERVAIIEATKTGSSRWWLALVPALIGAASALILLFVSHLMGMIQR